MLRTISRFVVSNQPLGSGKECIGDLAPTETASTAISAQVTEKPVFSGGSIGRILPRLVPEYISAISKLK
jgi:hypothetical protein